LISASITSTSVGKGLVGYLLPDYGRLAIRPHVLGRFRTLLGAVAKSSAMLIYLDNWLNVAPGTSRVREAAAGVCLTVALAP